MSGSQRTLKRSVSFSGVGLHSGQNVCVQIRPASANTGILFQRTDLPNQPYIKASPLNVFDTSLATRLGTKDVSVSTIEHLMAAFFGFGIDNAIVAVDGPELPILDGSSAPFLVILDEAGIVELKEKRKVLVVNKVIEVVDEKNPSRFIRIEPSKTPLLSYSIAFDHAKAIGAQSVSLSYTARAFCEEFSFARTFCLKEEIDYMRSLGLAKGGSLENAVVVSKEHGLLNDNGLRNPQEFVRHKALDCVGDLHLIGLPILGHVIAHKAGHDLHVKLGQAILKGVEARSAIILEPTAKEQPVFKELLRFPKSLLDVEQSMTSLVVG